MIRTDVLVIGGGVIGTAITYYLTRRGLSVALVEAKDLAAGTSGACGGSITMQTKRAGPLFACALRSQQLYRELGDELGQDVEYEQHGSLIVAETDAELSYASSLAAAKAELGLEVEWIVGPGARQWGEGLGPSIRGASYCPTDAEVNPLRVVFAFADAAKRQGAKIHTYTPVTGIRTAAGRVVGVRTDRGDFTAHTVVNAAGVWAPMIGEMIGMDVPIRPRRGVVLVSEPAPFHVHETLFSTKYLVSKRHDGTESDPADVDRAASGGLVLSETRTGNLLVGSSREFVGYDVTTPIDIIEFIAREAVRVLPAMANVSMIRAYAGLRPLSPDGLPMIGLTEQPGLIVATGHEGDGIALAPWTGESVAELVETGDVPQSLEPFDPRRLSAPIGVSEPEA